MRVREEVREETQRQYNERQVLTCRYLCNQSSND